jgi:hypothetical protein
MNSWLAPGPCQLDDELLASSGKDRCWPDDEWGVVGLSGLNLKSEVTGKLPTDVITISQISKKRSSNQELMKMPEQVENSSCGVLSNVLDARLLQRS